MIFPKIRIYVIPGPFDLVRVEFALTLPHKLHEIIEYCPKTEPQTFEKHEFQHVCLKLNFDYGLKRNHLGQNDHTDRGITSGFHQKRNFDERVTG